MQIGFYFTNIGLIKTTIMQREYYIKGKRVSVEEIENVSAVRSELSEADKNVSAQRDFSEALSSTLTELGLENDSLQAFANANWLFMPSGDEGRAQDFDILSQETGKLIQRPNGRIAVVTKRLNVQLDPLLNAHQSEEVLKENGLKIIQKLEFAPNFYEVETLRHSDSLEASVDLNSKSHFILAEPTFIEHIPTRALADDPEFKNQWQWVNSGQDGGTVGADVNIEEAWKTTMGAGVKVSVIDNGFKANHEDLRDGVSAYSGYFRKSSNERINFIQSITGMPDSSHGTFCAGMVGARRNGVGGCGAAPECELVLIACLGDQVGSQTTLARAVAYAALPSTEIPGADPSGGSDILVCSLGPNVAEWDLTETLKLAIEFASVKGRDGRGTAIFWAASNGNNVDISKDEVVSHNDVIAVVRSTRHDLEHNAARGSKVELIAPGVDVINILPVGYGPSTGTSFAAPCAAGCAALALAANDDLTRDELRAIMRNSADKIGGVVYDAAGHNDDYGFGRINAGRAVEYAISKRGQSSGLASVGNMSVQSDSDSDTTDHLMKVRLTASSLDKLRSYIEEVKPDLGCRPSVRKNGEYYITDVFIHTSKLQRTDIVRQDIDVASVVIEDITASGLERQAEVGQGNRYEARGVIPTGLGEKK